MKMPTRPADAPPPMPPLMIDGSQGEGGGQILRSSLALSLATGRPFRIERIRAGRDKPGLRRQHLTAVEAAAAVGRAAIEGAALGSMALAFTPGAAAGGDYRFAIGTAGSTSLVLQTVLPALLTASKPSVLVLEGGTHNQGAPPFDFLERTFLPLVSRMGPRISAVLDRPGFYPAGGGAMRVAIAPAERLARLDVDERGAIVRRRAVARVARLPEMIARRELETLRESLGWKREEMTCEVLESSWGPGNVVVLEIESERLTEVFSAFGRRGVAAEEVAREAAAEARRYLASAAPVGPHLADQLLVPMALAGGGCFRTVEPSEHTRTNIEVIKRFLPVEVRLAQEGPDLWKIDVESA
jgi:RNA 3'-terminal phosphate cyclase (ATP)